MERLIAVFKTIFTKTKLLFQNNVPKTLHEGQVLPCIPMFSHVLKCIDTRFRIWSAQGPERVSAEFRNPLSFESPCTWVRKKPGFCLFLIKTFWPSAKGLPPMPLFKPRGAWPRPEQGGWSYPPPPEGGVPEDPKKMFKKSPFFLPFSTKNEPLTRPKGSEPTPPPRGVTGIKEKPASNGG